MTDAVWLALIGAVPPTLASVAALIVSLSNGRKVEEVRKNTNGLVDDKVNRAHDDGKKVGRTEAFEELSRSGLGKLDQGNLS